MWTDTRWLIAALLAPVWLLHYLARRLLGDAGWKLQHSLALFWPRSPRPRQDEGPTRESVTPAPLRHAVVFLRYGRLERARAQAQAYVAEHPQDPRGQEMLACVQLAEQREAVGRELPAALHVAYLLLLAGRLRSARHEVSAYLAQFPGDRDGVLLLQLIEDAQQPGGRRHPQAELQALGKRGNLS